jgi:hypothetical protein
MAQNNIKTFQNQNQCINYKQTLVNCVLLADVVYEENPKVSLESSGIKHNIEKMACSIKLPKDEGIESFYELKYMVCVNDNIKQVIVAFCETQQMDDYFANFDPHGFIDNCFDCIHSTIFSHSIQIPIKYFLEKIFEDYQLVFTGHGLGGAMASIVATNCLRFEGVNGDKKRETQILTIAFGTPPFVTAEFKKLIELDSQLKERFHFYYNENDLVVKLFDVLINCLADETPKLPSKKDANKKLQCLANDIITSKDVTKHSDLVKLLNKVSNHKYVFFGLLFHSVKLVPISMNNSSFDVKLLRSQYLIKDHSMRKYFQDLRTFYLKDNIEAGYIKISDLTCFTLPKELKEYDQFKQGVTNAFVVKFIVNEFTTDIIISILCANAEFIRCASIKIFNEKNKRVTYKGCHPEHNFDWKIYSLIFSCSNEVFPNIEEKIKHAHPKDFENKVFECNIIAHFNSLEISFSTENKLFIKGLTVKKNNIERMPLDILYIYAIFYVNIMNKVEDAQFRDRCEELKKIFIELDKRWKLEGNSHDYNSKNKKKLLKEQLKEYFGDLIRDFLDDDQKKEKEILFSNKYVSLQKYTNWISFSDGKNNHEKDKEKFQIENFFKNIYPTCYEIHRKQQKNFYIQEVKNYSSDTFDAERLSEVFSNIGATVKDFPVNLVRVRGIILGLNFLAPLVLLNSISNTSYYFALGTYCKDIEDDYFRNPRSHGFYETVGFYENQIKKLIETGSLKNDQRDDYLQTILLNRKIRDILSAEILIGVVGKKNKGKSTFVKEITGINTNPDSREITYKMQLCKLVDSIKVIDYPDCEKANHRIQFTLSRYLFDYVFMVCAAIDEEAEANKELINSIRGACGENFTVILNRIDDNLFECNFDIDKGKKIVKEIKSKFAKEFNTKNFLVTYLAIQKKREMLDFVDNMELLTSKKLKSIVYNIILDKILKGSSCQSTEESLKNLIRTAEEYETIKFKKITIENIRGKSLDLIIAKDKHSIPKNHYDEEILIFDLYENLQDEIQELFCFNKRPNFYLKGDTTKIFEDLEGLLNSNGLIFVAKT